LLVLMTDVTELRRLETIRSDFAANVSHELRTPITSIKGYVETMLDVGVRDEAQTRRFLEIIGRSVARLASIVEDLLALARLEQPGTRSTLEKQSAALKRVIESAVAEFEDDARAKNMTLVTRVPGDLRMLANVQLIEQALGNLISNAVKYSPPGTSVTITADVNANGDVVISVSDQGPGIPSEHLTRIFERFYRVDRARSREMGGTGLGLSIVKHIARVHGGSATVESEVGHGSTFRLTIPAT
jgi:two-component system phosphate regulon sensor histidine kinase PhoR